MAGAEQTIRRVELYPSDEVRKQWEAEAAKQGVRLGTWARRQIEIARSGVGTSGPVQEVLRKSEERAEAAEQHNVELMAKVTDLGAKLEDLTTEVHALRLREGVGDRAMRTIDPRIIKVFRAAKNGRLTWAALATALGVDGNDSSTVAALRDALATLEEHDLITKVGHDIWKEAK